MPSANGDYLLHVTCKVDKIKLWEAALSTMVEASADAIRCPDSQGLLIMIASVKFPRQATEIDCFKVTVSSNDLHNASAASTNTSQDQSSDNVCWKEGGHSTSATKPHDAFQISTILTIIAWANDASGSPVKIWSCSNIAPYTLS
jgi:hypothetical protein